MTAEGSVLSAYRALATRPGATVRLADLRERIGGWMADDAVTRTLLQLDRARVFQLEPDPERAALTARDWAAVVSLAGREMHLVREVAS